MVNYGAVILLIAVALFFIAGGKNLLQNAFGSLQNSFSQPTPKTNTPTQSTSPNGTQSSSPPTGISTPIVTKTGSSLADSQPAVLETAVIGGTAAAPSSIKTIVNPITIKNQQISNGVVQTKSGTFEIGGGASPQVASNIKLFTDLISGETESEALGAPTLVRGSQQEIDALAAQAKAAATNNPELNTISNSSFALGGRDISQLTNAQKIALGLAA